MDNVTGSENKGTLSELETEAEAEEAEPGAAALEEPEEQPTSIPAAIAAEQRSAMPLCKCHSSYRSFLFKKFVLIDVMHHRCLYRNRRMC